jgi:hypothetical protein
MLLTGSDLAWAQQLVRLTRGEGASILPNGPNYRLGDTSPQPPAGITLEGSPNPRICCSRAGSASCITERQVPLDASRADVLGRYGPARPGSGPQQLLYPGVTFDMADGKVAKICVVPL